jgi:hypothetical protein
MAKTNFLRWLMLNKEGAALGAIGGALYASWYKQAGGELIFAVQTNSIFDSFINTQSLMELATTKFFVICIAVGLLIGATIDAIYKPKR